jgi:ribosomal protein S18 acetylase RimI-like enzyme
MPRIVQALSDGQITLARELFREYAGGLGVDLCFQGFESELRELPGDYAAPAGRLLLAFEMADRAEQPAGCGALRPLDAGICEMKRLYVRSAFRGHGVGRALAGALVAAARKIGYTAMRLDTLPAMREAQGLYAAMGFHEIGAYRENPVPGSRFLELDLTRVIAK